MGYKKNLTPSDYAGIYDRLDIAKRCVDLPVESTWREEPQIIEDEENETAFEKAWYELNERLGVYHYLTRLDKLSGLGQYGVLLVGYDDGEDLNTEVKKGSGVIYLRPFSEANATVSRWVEDTKDPRYGMPLEYALQYSTSDRQSNKIQSGVHYSRILHVADGLLEDNVYGTPRLRAIWNTLKNIELVAYSSAEMFFRGAFPGMVFNAAEGADLNTLTSSDFTTAIEDYIHQMKRYIKLQGIDVQQLTPSVVDPNPHLAAYYDQISAATGIPKRILLGSERGELASSQDERGWNYKVMERQKNYAEPRIIRPLIDMWIALNVLPEPAQPYVVQWADLNAASDMERADIAVKRTDALAKYASSSGADMIVPPRIFLRDIMGFEKYEVDEIDEQVGDMLLEEEKERKEAEIETAMNPTKTPQLPAGKEEDEEDDSASSR
jgi:hypothetical protein